MATTTPNYGWPVPTSTDYVKDGATAIEALGDAIDATVFALPSGAETVITSGNITAQSTINFTNVLSSTYKFYNFLFYIDNGSANAQDLYMRFRENTTDKSASYYQCGAGSNVSASVGAYFGRDNVNAITLGLISSTLGDAVNCKITRPSATTGYLTYSGWTAYTPAGYAGGATNSAMSNFTGFTLFTSSGTVTGSYILTGIK